jgi:hypothetical protein
VPFTVLVCNLGGESGLKNTEQVVYKQDRRIVYSDTVDENENEDKDKELVEPLSNF